MANTTADKLAKLESTKADLKAAILEKGGSVGDVFSEYPAAVRSFKNIDTYEKEQIMASTVPPLYGLGSGAIPSSILEKLSTSVLYSESTNVNEKTSDITGAYINALGAGYASKTAPSYDAESGEYKFSGQTYRCTGASWGSGYKATSKGTSWAYQTIQNDNAIKYYIPDDAKNTYVYIETVYAGSGSDLAYFYSEKPAKLYEKVTVVDSELKTVLGNLIHVPASQIYGAAKIATGSYVGTGKYGSNNKNNAYIGFIPKLFLVYSTYNYPEFCVFKCEAMTDTDKGGMFMDVSTSNDISGNSARFITDSGGGVRWWNSNDAERQFNRSGETYYYFALG